MTTANSPIERLREQADKIAANVKAIYDRERGHRENLKIGVAMDDKIITITFEWADIAKATEKELSDIILSAMQIKTETLQ